MKGLIVIPEDVVNSGISSDAKILYGLMINAQLNNAALDIQSIPFIVNPEQCLKEIESLKLNVTTPCEQIQKPVKKEKPKKQEDWRNPDIGILVGPNGKKLHRVSGVWMQLFLKMWEYYGGKDGKRGACWSFYNVIMQEDMKDMSTDEMKNYSKKLINASRSAGIKNEHLKAEGRTPQMMQGWLTERRYEDYFND